MALFPRLRARLEPRRATVTDGDNLASVSQQIKDLLPQQKGRPMRNWLTGFVATTGFKYLITMIAQFVAVKLGIDQGATEGLLAQLVALIMGAWGMYESSKSKVVIAGVKERIPSDATPAQAAAIAGNVAQKAAQ